MTSGTYLPFAAGTAYGWAIGDSRRILQLAHVGCEMTTFCRNPLHPGPCKGWKHHLGLVSPGALHALEKARHDKLEEKRVAKVADLKAAGKAIPKHLQTPIVYDPAKNKWLSPDHGNLTPGLGVPTKGLTPESAQATLDKIPNKAAVNAKVEASQAAKKAAAEAAAVPMPEHAPTKTTVAGAGLKVGDKVFLHGYNHSAKPGEVNATLVTVQKNPHGKGYAFVDQNGGLVSASGHSAKWHLSPAPGQPDFENKTGTVGKKPSPSTSSFEKGEATKMAKLADLGSAQDKASGSADAMEKISKMTIGKWLTSAEKGKLHKSFTDAHAKNDPGTANTLDWTASVAAKKISNKIYNLGEVSDHLHQAELEAALHKDISDGLIHGKPTPVLDAAMEAGTTLGQHKPGSGAKLAEEVAKKLGTPGSGQDVPDLGNVKTAVSADKVKVHTNVEAMVDHLKATAAGKNDNLPPASVVGLFGHPDMKEALDSLDPETKHKALMRLAIAHEKLGQSDNHADQAAWHASNDILDKLDPSFSKSVGSVEAMDKLTMLSGGMSDAKPGEIGKGLSTGSKDALFQTFVQAHKNEMRIPVDSLVKEAAAHISKSVELSPEAKSGLESALKKEANDAVHNGTKYTPLLDAAIHAFSPDASELDKKSFESLITHGTPAAAAGKVSSPEHVALKEKATGSALALSKAKTLAEEPHFGKVDTGKADPVSVNELMHQHENGTVNAKGAADTYAPQIAEKVMSKKAAPVALISKEELQQAVHKDIHDGLMHGKPTPVLDAALQAVKPGAGDHEGAVLHQAVKDSMDADAEIAGKAKASADTFEKLGRLASKTPMPQSTKKALEVGLAKAHKEGFGDKPVVAADKAVSNIFAKTDLGQHGVTKDELKQALEGEAQDAITNGHTNTPVINAALKALNGDPEDDAALAAAVKKHLSVPATGLTKADSMSPSAGKSQHVQDAVKMANGHISATDTKKLEAYEKLSAAELHDLDPNTKKLMAANLAGMKKKFLAKSKQDKAQAVLDKLNSGTPAHAPSMPSTPSAPSEASAGAKPGVTLLKHAQALKVVTAMKSFPEGQYLSSPENKIWDNVVAIAHHEQITPMQALATIDDQNSKKLMVTNEGLLEKKIRAWLATPDGKKYAEANKSPKTALVDHLDALKKGETNFPNNTGISVPAGHKVQEVGGPGEFNAKKPGSDFQKLTTEQAEADQNKLKKDLGISFTPQQLGALREYVDGSSAINGWLRDQYKPSQQSIDNAIHLQSMMMPLPKDHLLMRGTGWTQFPPENRSYEGLLKMVGHEYQEPAFLSTSVSGSAQGFGGAVKMHIEAPAGTMAVFTKDSQYKSQFLGQEAEMLLAAGTQFRVTKVWKTGTQIHMQLRIVS